MYTFDIYFRKALLLSGSNRFEFYKYKNKGIESVVMKTNSIL